MLSLSCSLTSVLICEGSVRRFYTKSLKVENAHGKPQGRVVKEPVQKHDSGFTTLSAYNLLCTCQMIRIIKASNFRKCINIIYCLFRKQRP